MSGEYNLNLILDAIENQKCILLLGPELNNIGKDITIERALKDHLVAKGIELKYYQDENLYLFKGKKDQKLSHEIKQFYQNSSVPPIFEKIAQIPFHLVLSITPDLFLNRTFDKFNFACKCSVYSKDNNPEEISRPSKEIPLLYYLFGSYEKLSSLVLTHNDLFCYIEAILSKFKLPNELINAMLDAENFIFLGFKFDNWIVQILMRHFDSKISVAFTDFNIDRYALSTSVKPATKSFFINEFEMRFIDDDYNEFLNQLFEEFRNRGKLRTAKGKDVLTVRQLDDCVMKGDLDKAFECLRQFIEKDVPGVEKEEINSLIISNSGMYEELKRKQNKQVISFDDYTRERNKIQDSVQEIIKSIKKLLSIS
jgi:hypothetical protein